MRKIDIDKIECCRWSRANERKPAIMMNYLPSPLTMEELERTLVQTLDERQKFKNEIKKWEKVTKTLLEERAILNTKLEYLTRMP